MENQGLKLKEFIKKSPYNQKEFAELVGVAPNYISMMIKGTKPITDAFILNITKVMPDADVSYISDNNIFKDRKENYQMINTNGNKFEERSYGYDLEINLLPFDSYASYSETLENVLVAYDFEKVTFNVDKYGLGNYMAFKIKGDSMNGGHINDTMDKALVLGRELGRHHWMDGFGPTDYGWIILSKKNIYHKDIIGLDRKTGDIICHSRNPDVEDFTLNLNDVYQIFKVIKRIQ